jgi:hypothetical protein
MLNNKTAVPKHFGIESSPLYFGAPARRDGLKPLTLGGGLAEPLAMHTLAPRKKAVGNTGNDVRVPQQQHLAFEQAVAYLICLQ